MENKDVIIRYGSHYDAIKKIGNYPLCYVLQLSDLGEPKKMKAITQRCYNDMKKDFSDFAFSVIEYLCLISALYLRNETPATENSSEKEVKYIIKNYENKKEETRNMLRFLVRRPEFFFKVFNTKNIELYKELFGFWCNLYMKEYNQINKDKSAG